MVDVLKIIKDTLSMLVFPSSAYWNGEDIKVEDTILLPKHIAWEFLIMLDMLLYTYIYSVILSWFHGYMAMHGTYTALLMVVMFWTSAMVGNSVIRYLHLKGKI